ncbi:phage tail assembly chaperone [Martelella soudanensis]|uniref:phage tail assembly chaperone n=1 Tax=Martelella sp. NC20 TaxID=2740298 RepID=UPI0035305361
MAGNLVAAGRCGGRRYRKKASTGVLIADHVRTLFELAVASERLNWSPATFWAATPSELSMAIAGVTGKSAQTSPVSHTRIREIVAGHGSQQSIRRKAEPR